MPGGFPLQTAEEREAGFEAMVERETKAAADALSVAQIEGMRRIRNYGSMGWCKGQGRAGGAVARMFKRMCEAGLMKGPPYELTAYGKAVLDHIESARTPRILGRDAR